MLDKAEKHVLRSIGWGFVVACLPTCYLFGHRGAGYLVWLVSFGMLMAAAAALFGLWLVSRRWLKKKGLTRSQTARKDGVWLYGQ